MSCRRIDIKPETVIIRPPMLNIKTDPYKSGCVEVVGEDSQDVYPEDEE